MKKIKSLSLVVIMALLVGLTAALMAGCDNTEKEKDYVKGTEKMT